MSPDGPVWLDSAEAAARRGWKHPGSIRRVAESAELHGHKRSKRGRWTFRDLVIDAWTQGASEARQKEVCGCLRVVKRAGAA
jgi:hypothetical protein